MRLKKVFAGALAAAMLVCAVAVPAFAAEEVEQENCLTSSYVQMNIPYADFYKAAGVALFPYTTLFRSRKSVV